MWESFLTDNMNPVHEDWSGHMGGALSTVEYLEENDQILVAPGASYVAPEDSSEISTLRNQVKSTIVEYSWRMVFANDEEEFNSLLAEMQDIANGLGYEQVLEVDMANAQEQNERREFVAEEFGETE